MFYNVAYLKESYRCYPPDGNNIQWGVWKTCDTWVKDPETRKILIKKAKKVRREMAGFSISDCAKINPFDSCAKEAVPYQTPENRALNTAIKRLQDYVNEDVEQEEEKEHNMYLDTEKSYLLNRLDLVSLEKGDAARKEYGLQDDDAPKTPTEIVERIKSGKYVLPKEEENDYYGTAYRNIRWRDPAKEEDKEGYNDFQKKLRAAESETRDSIVVLEQEVGLKALRDFQAATFY